MDALATEERDRFLAERLCERAVPGTPLAQARDVAVRFFRALGVHVLMEELLALDLFVTDVVMPGLSGDALIRTICEAGGEAELAIVAMSARLDPALERTLEAAGADAVLDKALGAELVAQAADAVLERKRLVRHADAA